MKIAIITSKLPPEGIGGTEIVSYNTAKSLAKKGNEVHVITSGDKTTPKQELLDGFNVHRILYPKVPILGVIFFWFKIYVNIEKIIPDIVHCQTAQMGLPCFFAKKILNIPYIVFCHGSDVYLKWKFKALISKTVFSCSGAVIALTEDMKSRVKTYYKKEIFVIPNGIYLENFEKLLGEGARKKFKIDHSEKIILFVGSLKIVKGLEYLIEAFKIVEGVENGSKLFLVGEGQERQKLECLVEKYNLGGKVIFIGSILNSDIPEYMAMSDIFVLPSLSEGMPIVILEAMASGIPIVTTNVRGIPEIVIDGENGFLVEPRNPDKIAEKILYLLSNENVRKSISLNNKEKSKNYSLDSIIDRLTEIYLMCLDNKSNGII